MPQLRVATQVLELAETFTIANASSDEERVCLVTLEHEGVTAQGEGAPVDYWGGSAEMMREALEEEGVRLLGNEPFTGLGFVDGRVICSDAPGRGLSAT